MTPVILGLLATAPLSGYEIKAIVDRSTRFFWAASYSQIYPELRRLEQDGLIIGNDEPSRRPRAPRLRADRSGPRRARGVARRPGDDGRAPGRVAASVLLRGRLPPEQALMLLEGGDADTRNTSRACARSTRGPERIHRSSTSFCAGASPSTSGEHNGARTSCSGCAATRIRADRAVLSGESCEAGMPGFLREGFLPLGAFYVGLAAVGHGGGDRGCCIGVRCSSTHTSGGSAVTGYWSGSPSASSPSSRSSDCCRTAPPSTSRRP